MLKVDRSAELCSPLAQSVICAAFVALALPTASSFAQCAAYSVDVIAGPPCKDVPATAIVTGINEAGACCGGYTSCSGLGHPTVWTQQGGVSNIQLPPGFGGGGCTGVNENGQASGYMGAPDRGFFSSNGVAINIGTLPGHNWSQAYAINDDGVICGASNNTATGPLSAFYWQNGKMHGLNLPYGDSSVANDISNNGRVCGWMGPEPVFDAHAFIYDIATGTTVDVGTPLPDTSNATATGISADGETICGWSYIRTPCYPDCVLGRKSFVWSKGVAEDLGVLPGFQRTFAYDVNDSGNVVGFCDLGAVAFVWHDGVMTALNDLIPADAQLDIIDAHSINNAGQIAGYAIVTDGSSDVVGVRLTPMPSMPGDYNCDRIVNTADLLGVINHWNITGNNPADFNHDGTVNALDLMIVIQNWTK